MINLSKEKKPNVFLIQKSGKRPAEHLVTTFPDRSYAEETINYKFYRNDSWDIRKRDQDFEKVNLHDYILVYCTGDVEESPKQIKYIYEVINKERVPEREVQIAIKNGKISEEEAKRFQDKDHILQLKPIHVLQRGIELPLIRKWVEEGKLSENMNNCGRLGFNICQVSYEDYESIINWEKLEEVPFEYAGYEDDVRSYLAQIPLEKTIGNEYKDFILYEDEGLSVGELFGTPVGQIDLLYRNKETGDFLVIEVKRGSDTSDKTVGQIARYIGWVEEQLAENNLVKGIIVSQGYSEKLKYAIKALKNCEVYTFEFKFEFKREL